MEQKKNKKYELEPKRHLFFGIGMSVALSLTLVAFEWKSPIEPLVVIEPEEEGYWHVVIEDPHITKHDLPKMPEPVENKKIVSQTIIIKEVKELTEALEIEEPIIDIDNDIADAISSESNIIEVPDDPFIVVEDMPEFPGGEVALLEYIAKNVKYPRKAKNLGIEGRVFLKFVIDSDGSISNVELMKGIGAGCDEEAIRVVKMLPNFIPGKQRGVPVKVQMQLPINFKLQ
ncbi:MAG: energy transducer TonB [Bacteroidota bacterium]